MKDFVHLHVHSEYSILDSAAKIRDVIDKCGKLGQKAVAFTEHGNINSALRAYLYAKSKNIKYIPGVEAYIVDDMTKKGSDEEEDEFGKKKRPKKNHIVLLAKNDIGFKNLLKITSFGYIDGFYYKPRIDLNLIEKYKEGIVVLSACVFGIIADKILYSTEQDLQNTVVKFKNMFGDDFYLEIQPHNFKEQIVVNKKIIELSKKHNIKLVATNDVHYTNEGDHIAQQFLTMLNMKIAISQYDKSRLNNNTGFHFKTREEMFNDFMVNHKENEIEINEALDNSNLIADKVNVAIDTKTYKLPKFTHIDVDKTLQDLIHSRWDKISVDMEPSKIPLYVHRIRHEYKIIKEKNLLDFLYIIYDVVLWANKNGVMTGVGRGSACGSLLCYLLDITKIDPIQHDLLFERFINANRMEMPDIDIDFDHRYRYKIKEYLVSKYGEQCVSSIGAFSTFQPRGLLKDLARVYELPLDEIDAVTKTIPFDADDFDKALNVPQVSEYFKKYPHLLPIATRLQGQIRHFSTHAAGLAISNRSLFENVPLCRYKNELITGWDEGGEDIKCISEMKIMKLDCLGLATLGTIKDTIDLIKQTKKKDLYDFLFYKLPLNDPEVLRLAHKADTTGVFQFESYSIKNLLEEVGIQEFEHLVAVNALHRPATLRSGFAKEYALRKNRIKEIKYVHSSLEKPLSRSYGLMLFQEDSMRIARDVAGYTLEEADDLRKVTSKGAKLYQLGQGHLVDEAKQRFLDRCVKNGTTLDQAKEIFGFIEKFLSYSFNRSHAVAYSYIAYQCLYLKRYYPLEYMTALLNNSGSEDDLKLYARECKKMKIVIHSPRINESKSKFVIFGSEMLCGFSIVKNVGEKAADSIVQNQPYRNYKEFLAKVNRRVVNKRVIAALNKYKVFSQFSDFSLELTEKKPSKKTKIE